MRAWHITQQPHLFSQLLLDACCLRQLYRGGKLTPVPLASLRLGLLPRLTTTTYSVIK